MSPHRPQNLVQVGQVGHLHGQTGCPQSLDGLLLVRQGCAEAVGILSLMPAFGGEVGR